MSDTSSNAYILPDTPWMELSAVAWGAVTLAVAVTVIAVVSVRQQKRTRNAVLGIAALVLIVGGFFVQTGRSIYVDSEGQWYCPSGINAVQITEAPGQPLPEGVAECRAAAQREVPIGVAMAGLGIAITVGLVITSARALRQTRRSTAARPTTRMDTAGRSA